MTILLAEAKIIAKGAEIAKRNELYRLGGLLQACAELGDEVWQGQFPDRREEHEIILNNLFEYATKVSNDLINGEARREAEVANDVQGTGL